jgi:hypothetical protein
MSDVEEIKRLLRALIDRGLGDDISNQLRNLLDIPMMPHREALERHADLVARARKGERPVRDDKHTTWTNEDLVYVLTDLSCWVEHIVTSGSNTIILWKKTDGHLDQNADSDHAMYNMYMGVDFIYYVKTSPTLMVISRIGDGRELCLSYDEDKLCILYDCEATEDWYWKIHVVDDKVTISRPDAEDVVFKF